MDILYGSQAILARIRGILASSSYSGRRVVLVAYIGKDYASFLPDPAQMEIVCNPTAGATDPTAISELCRAKADVYFSDKLHMKVYWSEKRGCVITSANLSRNAFGVKGLKEAGVYVEAGAVEIERFLAQAKPYRVNGKNLERLKLETEELDRILASTGKGWRTRDNFTYADWYRRPPLERKFWKLGWWTENAEVATDTRDWLNKNYGSSKPNYWLNFANGDAAQGDWFLAFRIAANNEIKNMRWMYADHIVRMSKNDPAYDKDYPYQVFQAEPLSRCPEHPFRITLPFKVAFQTAAKKYGINKIVDSTNVAPPSALLKFINQFLE